MNSMSLRPNPRVALLITALIAVIVGGLLITRPDLPAFVCALPLSDGQVAAYRGLAAETVQLLHTQRGLTVEDICRMPQDKLGRAILRVFNPKPDHPGEAVEFRMLQLQDENGYIPPDGFINAALHIEEMRAAQVPAASAGISPGSWTWLGPGNIGGRVRAILIHPTTPSTMWVGSVSGGIWKTTNGGASWQAVNDFMGNLAITSLIMQPGDPNVMYAGTGEGFYNIDAIRGAGVFKSTDGGTTWTQLSSTNNSNWYYVNRLAISPNGSAILAATGSGIWRSTDGGSTWSQVNTDGSVKDVQFHPTDNNQAVASGSYGRAWYSTNGGASWTAATGLPTLDWLGRVEVAYAPSNGTIVYAGVSQNSGEVWKSSDGGHSYTLVNTGTNYLGGQGWYDNMMWVDPTNANTLVVGGTDLRISTNGGTTLTDIGGYTGGVHPDQHILVAPPGFNGSTNKTVFVGNDGGVFTTANIYTANGSSGWQELNNNLGITQFYGAAGNTTSGVIVGGTQDNGTLRYSGGTENWTAMAGGDGGFDAADQTDSNYFYGEYVDLMIHRSTNGGVSSSYIYNGIADAGSNANFIAPFILDPNNPNTMLAGGASLWRSANVKAGTPTWAAIKAAGASVISAIAAAQGNSNIIWVGHNNGDVYMTTNGAVASPTWTKVDANSPGLPNRYVTRITIDKNNLNKVYVTFGGFSADNVWQTTNGGTTWADITGSGATGLPDAPVRSLVVNPSNSNWLYVGTEVGIFASEDGGAHWGIPQDGPANVSVDELFWMGTKLVAATHGRGLFSAQTSTQTCYSLYLTVSPANSGSITPNPTPNCNNNTQYTPGTPVTLTANANSGYTFSSWSGDASGSSNPTTVTMSSDKSVTANFTGGSDAVTSVETADGNWNAKSVFNAGDSIIYVGYGTNTTGSDQTAYFDWEVNGPCGSIASWTGNLTNANGEWGWGLPTTVPSTACAGTYTYQLSVTWNGSTSSQSTTFTVNQPLPPPSNDDFDNPIQVNSNSYNTNEDTTNATTASDDPALCAGSVGSASVWFRFTPSSSGMLNANTIGSGYDTVLGVWTGARGSLSQVACDDDSGGNLTSALSANLNGGTTYYLEVTRYGAGYGPVPVQKSNLNPKQGILTLTGGGGSMSLSVTFAPTPCYTLTKSANPGAGGSVNASPSPNCNGGTQYTSGTVVQLTATANSGYAFASWSGDASGTANPVSVTMTAAKSVTANFTACYSLATIANPVGGGSVTASPPPNCNGGTQYTSGTVVQLTATANSGYAFASWSGDASGIANPVSVTLSAAKSVTANFIACYSLATIANPVGGGSVTASPSPNCNGGTQYTSGTVVQITAIASSSYYRFLNWSGDAIGAANPVSVTMNGDKTVTANFTACLTNKCLLVVSITMSKTALGVQALVTVKDENGVAVPSARMYVHWGLPVRTPNMNKLTNSTGVAVFTQPGEKGTYTITVTNITKFTYTYDAADSTLVTKSFIKK